MAPDLESGCRVALGLMFVGAGCIGIPHRLRADRTGGSIGRAVDPRWFWVIMSVVGPPVGLTGVAFLIDPRWVDFAMIDIPPGLRLLGVPVGLLGLGLFNWMFRHLGLNVTSTSMPRAKATLVTTGPYRWVRHPMYSTVVVLFFAATMLTANWVVAAGGGLVFALLAARSRVEERRLVEKFGDAYRAYQRSTGRFMPGVGRGW